MRPEDKATLLGLLDGSLVPIPLKLIIEAHACMRACGWHVAPASPVSTDGVLEAAVVEIEAQFAVLVAAHAAATPDTHGGSDAAYHQEDPEARGP